MDKGSRQISIVTLGKGMALVVGYGTLEDRSGDLGGRDDGCYPFRGAAGCRPSFRALRKLIGLGSLGVSALQGGSRVERLHGCLTVWRPYSISPYA